MFDTTPGRLCEARITEIPRGTGQGQVATSGMLARVGSIGGANAYLALMSVPPTSTPSGCVSVCQARRPWLPRMSA